MHRCTPAMLASSANPDVARPTGVEPVTFGFGNQHSIQLSYGRIAADFTARAERPVQRRFVSLASPGIMRCFSRRSVREIDLRAARQRELRADLDPSPNRKAMHEPASARLPDQELEAARRRRRARFHRADRRHHPALAIRDRRSGAAERERQRRAESHQAGRRGAAGDRAVQARRKTPPARRPRGTRCRHRRAATRRRRRGRTLRPLPAGKAGRQEDLRRDVHRLATAQALPARRNSATRRHGRRASRPASTRCTPARSRARARCPQGRQRVAAAMRT